MKAIYFADEDGYSYGIFADIYSVFYYMYEKKIDWLFMLDVLELNKNCSAQNYVNSCINLYEKSPDFFQYAFTLEECEIISYKNPY